MKNSRRLFSKFQTSQKFLAEKSVFKDARTQHAPDEPGELEHPGVRFELTGFYFQCRIFFGSKVGAIHALPWMSDAWIVGVEIVFKLVEVDQLTQAESFIPIRFFSSVTELVNLEEGNHF